MPHDLRRQTLAAPATTAYINGEHVAADTT